MTPDQEKLLAWAVHPSGGQKFKGEDFRVLCGAQVYMFLLKGEPLYIGMSRHGLGRSGAKGHKQAAEARRICDEVLIWPCIHGEAARRLERLMIEPSKTSRKAKARPVSPMRMRCALLPA